MKNANVKLSYENLAQHMGSGMFPFLSERLSPASHRHADCSASGVRQHINKLRRDVEGPSAASNGSPAPTPKKRKAGGKDSQKPMPTKAAKVKKDADEEEKPAKIEDVDDGEEDAVKNEV